MESPVAQHLKDDVRARIDEAALRVFAACGFQRATVGAIARAAGTATGNLYRYYPDKTALFEAVVPDTFARGLLTRIRRRVRALEGVAEYSTLGPDAPFHAAAEELLRFSIENRLRVVILLGRSAGTRHHAFGEQLVRTLQRLAIAHFRQLRAPAPVDAARRFALDQVYQNWARTMVVILEQFADTDAILAVVDEYSRYHLAGLNALLGG